MDMASPPSRPDAPLTTRADAAHESPVVAKELETLAHALDGLFRIPGTQWRFGLDALAGLIPGVGDAATSIAAFGILVAAVRYRVPKVVLLRMALNLAIDYVVGSIPGVGDAFDFVWKANSKNLALLKERAGHGPAKVGAGDWVFVFGIIGALVLLLVLSVAVAAWLVLKLRDAVVGVV